MASEKKFRQQFNRFGSRDNVQELSASGASALQTTNVLRYGVTVLTSAGTGAGHTWTIDEPVKGVRKTIVVHGPGGSTLPAIIQTNSSAVTVGETTGNQITVSTAADTDGTVIDLIGLSTVAWVLGSNLQTGVTVAAATQTV